MKEGDRMQKSMKKELEDDKKKLRWFARQDEEIRLKVLQEMAGNYPHIKGEVSQPRAYHTALLKAISYTQNFLREDKRKAEGRELKTARERAKIKALTGRKPSKKNKLDKAYSKLVFRLKDEHNHSWREISSYLFRYHRFKINHETIRQWYFEKKEHGKEQ